MKLIHVARRLFHTVTETLLEFANLVPMRLRGRLLTGTRSIRVRRLGILHSRWMIVIWSPMAITKTRNWPRCLVRR